MVFRGGLKTCQASQLPVQFYFRALKQKGKSNLASYLLSSVCIPKYSCTTLHCSSLQTNILVELPVYHHSVQQIPASMWLPSWLLTEKFTPLIINCCGYIYSQELTERDRAQGQTGKVGMMMEQGLGQSSQHNNVNIQVQTKRRYIATFVMWLLHDVETPGVFLMHDLECC